jgi:hypothetical protein
MARHSAEVTSQEQGTWGEKRHQEAISDSLVVSKATASNRASAISCPINKCEGNLNKEVSGYDSRSGLEPMVCQQCGHRGFQSREGVMLLFRGGYEFKFTYGPSVQTITVVLSSASVNLWGTHDVNEEQLAKLAAEWALLCGRADKQVHLGIPAEEFADFYLYFCKHP